MKIIFGLIAIGLWVGWIPSLWGAVQTEYRAKDVVMVGFRGGERVVQTTSASVLFSTSREFVQLDNVSGNVWSKKGGTFSFSSDYGLFFQKDRILDMSGQVFLKSEDGAILQTGRARWFIPDCRIEFPGFLEIWVPNKMSNLLQFQMDAGRGKVWIDRQAARFEGRVNALSFEAYDTIGMAGDVSFVRAKERTMRLIGNAQMASGRMNAKAHRMRLRFSKKGGKLLGVEQMRFDGRCRAHLVDARRRNQKVSLDSSKMLVSFDESRKLDSVTATGKVVTRLPDGPIRSDRFDYRVAKDLMTFVGTPAEMIQERQRLQGRMLEYHVSDKTLRVKKGKVFRRE